MNLGSVNSSNLPLSLDRMRGNEKINGVSSLIQNLAKLQYGKHNDLIFFRGHSDSEWVAEPSIYRDGLVEKEHIIFREVIASMPEEFHALNSTFQKLVKMQHYGLPTRLLDITENPLIALYFACIDSKDKDGEILVYRVPRNEIKYFDSDTVSILANLAKMKNDFSIQEVQAGRLLHEIRQEKYGFLPNINLDDLSKVLFVKPLLDNQRIIRQDGSFSLFGMGENKSTIAKIPDEFKTQKDGKGFIVNAGSKENILKELEILGIHHAKLFPEIDKIANYIKRKHIA